MSRRDLDINTPEGLREFHEDVIRICGWAKKHPSGVWIDDPKYQKDNYHYWRSKRALDKLKKQEANNELTSLQK